MADDNSLELLMRMLSGLAVRKNELTQEERLAVIAEPTAEAVMKKLAKGEFKKIVVMCGAGISVAAGIPDFRSPGTGLYHNLQKYNLPEPTAIFDIAYFKKNPKPFFTLAKELYPGSFKPTPAHYFVKLLEKRGLLLRCYTQNIDTLERVAGVSPESLVEAHGTFATAHCLKCGHQYAAEGIKEEVFQDRVPTCTACGGVVKPDIVFFGENLPERFSDLVPLDLPEADLLLIMGTSLAVQPFASIASKVGPKCVRLLINREPVGMVSKSDLELEEKLGCEFGGLRCGIDRNYRDVMMLGDLQDSIRALCTELGWMDELEALMAEQPAAVPAPQVETPSTAVTTAPPPAADVERQQPAIQFDLDAPAPHLKGVAALTITGCPHVHAADKLTPLPDSIDVHAACEQCGDASENWLCLSCHRVLCSRYVNKHMALHANDTNHVLAVSLSDASVWCFECNAYIADKALDSFVDAVADQRS